MPDQTAPPSPLRTSLRYLNWLYNPYHGLDTAAVYDLLSTGAATERGLYLNLGYWQQADTLDDASDALAMLVGETARIGPGDTVLDVGFGFADQDLLWAHCLQPARIIGLNITDSQVRVARHRVAEQGLQEQIDLRLGSATDMPLESASVDAVLALECAFHFHTRERFFREAWRVLRPGGRLVTADIIPMPGQRGFKARLQQRLSWGQVAGKFVIPTENAYTRPTYHAKLAVTGFEQIRIASIRDQVYGPLHQYLARHPQALRRLHPIARQHARLALRLDPAVLYRGLDYVLASAMKPQQLRPQQPGAVNRMPPPA
ncbi:methyltransferase domain-containing protein [Thiohalocapsa marina]|uniref:Methyltransferase domain-containing protein n=1 Tax=Thiohalocapsa marina TaxID=424902 RepID=A0A5M8FNU7_9GAMM|nr:methyltransferase domain-containing protein [Thiohalocapsa marina]KAA6185670.1 methyltransferase domain-containing protein [Thiohalocapsa marina]